MQNLWPKVPVLKTLLPPNAFFAFLGSHSLKDGTILFASGDLCIIGTEEQEE